VRRALIFVMGVFAGQWLVFGSASSPAELHVKAQIAYEHRDYVEAMRLWSQAVSLQPDNAAFHYSRATALARLGLRLSAADAYQMSLLLDPPRDLARQAMEGLASLSPAQPAAGARSQDVTVPMESGLGVWITSVTVNGRHRGRFLVDTGSSVIVLAPAFAQAAGVPSSGVRPAVELQTLSGRTSGPSATLASLRVGDAELQNAPVVLHDPGPGLDGILGNTFLSQYRVTVDADRRELRLTSVARD
jgi:clan AA aspartic protease (TIGR02281 family)